MERKEFLATYAQLRDNLELVLRKGMLAQAEHEGHELFPDWDTLMFFIDPNSELEVHFQVKDSDNPDATIAGWAPLEMLFASKDEIIEANTWAEPVTGDDPEEDYDD